MKLLRYILFPLVPIYYLVTWLRNKLYDLGWKSSSSFDIPIICVGNLSVGGTGKTPMIEYLIKTLDKSYSIATLSRGYKRKSKGFIIADESADATLIGDEPFQFYNKFKAITVAVDSDRRNGISKLIELKQPDVILLDDAFQHRKVAAGLNILLTSYGNLYTNDYVLPTGNLREPKSGAKRADIIVVTKCPENLSDKEKRSIINQLRPSIDQQVFFSTIAYSEYIKNTDRNLLLSELKNRDFTLVTGIANPKPLVSFLKREDLQFEHLAFKDHHHFSAEDISKLKTKAMLITTEKDYVRLLPHFRDVDNLYYLPIAFTVDRSEVFEKLINDFLKKY